MRTYNDVVQNVNYDETKVPCAPLPDPLRKNDGSMIGNAFEWSTFRRPEILKFYQDNVYGKTLPRPDKVEYELLSLNENALEGTAVRKLIRIHFSMHGGQKHHMDLLLYLPKNAPQPVPAFLGLCFKSIHITTDEPDVPMTGLDYPDKTDWETMRGSQRERWSFREVIARGYASATVSYNDIFPDHRDGWAKSVYSLFFDTSEPEKLHAEYTSIGAWSWGISRALDCLECESAIDASRVAVHGHSRLGKTSLWAGASDQRFKMVISNDSGCGGAALFKRVFGENVDAILFAVPYWFVSSFKQYINNEAAMAFDQHFLISLMAPRPVCIASATEDLWADPKGEFLSGLHANPVYRLFGVPGMPTSEMPPPDHPVSGEVSYHLRTGKHNQTLQDWNHYLDLADRYL